MPSKRKTEAVWIESRARWQINVQANGKRRTFTSTNPGKRGKLEAERKADDWLEGGQKDNPRFDVAWAEFLKNVKDSTGTANYKKHESIGKMWLKPHLDKKRLGDITLQNLQDILVAAAKKGLARKSCQNIRGSITAFYGFARRNRYEMERPDALTVPKYAPVNERDILQPEDIKTLFTVDTVIKYKRPVKAWYIHAWRFFVLTGLRPGEVFGLRKEDVSDNGVIKIQRARNTYKEFTKGKNDNANRWFVLPKQARKVLADQAAMLKNASIISPWLFPDETGEITEQDHAARLWKTYRKQHGIRSSPYEFRHTMISAVSVSVPTKLIKKVVGHAENMDTQGVYAHELDGEAQHAANLIEDVFDKLLT